MTDKIEAAVEAGARAFYEAAREKGMMRWETASESFREDFRQLVRPVVVAALSAEKEPPVSKVGGGGSGGVNHPGSEGGSGSLGAIGHGAIGPSPRNPDGSEFVSRGGAYGMPGKSYGMPGRSYTGAAHQPFSNEALRQRASDALDAARYRVLRAAGDSGLRGEALDAFCDEEMRRNARRV